MAGSASKRPYRQTARALVVHDQQLLLMERWRNELHYFSIPGGGIEAGESAEEALIRELAEETGIKVNVERPVITMQAPDGTHQIFLCHYVSGEPVLAVDAPENFGGTNNRFKPGWQPLAALPTLPLIYWEPIRSPLLTFFREGFPQQPVIVTSDLAR